MTKYDEVLSFINRFTSNGKHQEVIECFSCGCCYWFAEILQKRFAEWRNEGVNVDIIYDGIINHYACQIGAYVFDITGDITQDPQYHWEFWDYYKNIDPLETSRLYRYCINFGGPEDDE